MAYDRLPESCPPLPGVPQVVYDAINALYLRFANQPQIVAWGTFDGQVAVNDPLIWLNSFGVKRDSSTRIAVDVSRIFLETPIPGGSASYTVLTSAENGGVTGGLIAQPYTLVNDHFTLLFMDHAGVQVPPRTCTFAVISR